MFYAPHFFQSKPAHFTLACHIDFSLFTMISQKSQKKKVMRKFFSGTMLHKYYFPLKLKRKSGKQAIKEVHFMIIIFKGNGNKNTVNIFLDSCNYCYYYFLPPKNRKL